MQFKIIKYFVAEPDPGSGTFLTPGSEIQDPVPFLPRGPGSRINIPDPQHCKEPSVRRGYERLVHKTEKLTINVNGTSAASAIWAQKSGDF